jgi:ATPase subunit of ABC transporter with duplicated ATPase domains
MPAFITLNSIAASTPDGRELFTALTLSIGAERIGVVGRNGSGKSTLMRIIAGEAEPSAGTLTRSGSIGVLRQSQSAGTVREALGVEAELSRVDRALAGDMLPEDADIDWTLPSRTESALADTGLASLGTQRNLATLSGGERMRVAIARLWLEQPDLLVLDEPTNNLDAEGREAIRRLVAGWKGGAVIASHDRTLLEHMDRIVELTPVGVTVFGGGWSEFAAAREEARTRAAQELERAEDANRQTARAAQRQKEHKAKRDSAGRAARARGDAPKMLMDAREDRAEKTDGRMSRVADRLAAETSEALETARARIEILTPLSIDMPTSGLHAGREVLSLKSVAMDIEGRRLWGPLDLEIRGPKRIAISGPNGSGKTMLLRVAAGEIDPSEGEVRTDAAMIARLDQHVSLLNDSGTLMENMQRLNPQLTPNAAHAALARFAFRNQAALKLAGQLSGGERLRAGLACVLSQTPPPQLLILDEPTNHLDIESIEILERALMAWDGALLVVSHDRTFLDEIGMEREVRL